MLNIFLQAWGGVFYLLNKVFFSRAERSNKMASRKWRIASWTVYLIGMPAWIIVFLSEHNFMAASVEAGGAFSMVFGLAVALRGKDRTPVWLDAVSLVAAFGGIGYSWFYHPGVKLPQILEFWMVVGFMFGTYFLAKEDKKWGYSYFMLMNGSNAALMWIEQYPWLALQQIVSLGFVVDAFLTQRLAKRLIKHSAAYRLPKTAEETESILKQYWIPRCPELENLIKEMDAGEKIVLAREPKHHPLSVVGEQSSRRLTLRDLTEHRANADQLFYLLLAYGKGRYELINRGEPGRFVLKLRI